MRSRGESGKSSSLLSPPPLRFLFFCSSLVFERIYSFFHEVEKDLDAESGPAILRLTSSPLLHVHGAFYLVEKAESGFREVVFSR